jgi:hypothetical protein
MKRIKEFEKKLAEQIDMLEGGDRTIDWESSQNTFSPSNQFLSAEGTIKYTYYSLVLRCEIEATYKGFRHYGNEKMTVDLVCKFRAEDE